MQKDILSSPSYLEAIQETGFENIGRLKNASIIRVQERKPVCHLLSAFVYFLEGTSKKKQDLRGICYLMGQ